MAKSGSTTDGRGDRFTWRPGDLVPASSSRRRGDAIARAGVGLGALRRKRKLTQVELAERLGMAQDQISKLERRGDVKLSTLVRYLEGLGADDVDLAVRFEDGEEIILSLGRGGDGG